MNVLRWFQVRSKDVGVILLAAMFLTFIVQVFMRYVIRSPLGWTLEVCLLLYLWLVFWCSAFLIKVKEHVTFDLIYIAAKPKTRRIFDIIAGTIVVLAFSFSYPATVDFVTFMKIEKTAVTLIRLDFVFSIYILFLTSAIIREGIKLFRFSFISSSGDKDKSEKKVAS